MWQAESYTIEIRNTSSCDTDDNIVVSKRYDAKDLATGHNTVNITGLCPSMLYWYCTRTVWVQYYRGMEMNRKTVTETGTFTTEPSSAETEDWDVSSGPCAGHDVPQRDANTVFFTLSNMCLVGDEIELPESITIDGTSIPIEDFQVSNIREIDGVYYADFRYKSQTDQTFTINSDFSSDNPDYIIIKR